MKKKRNIKFLTLIGTLISFFSCEWEKTEPLIPFVPRNKDVLEAKYITSERPISIHSPVWSEVHFHEVNVFDISKGKIYPEDGILNMTGTYEGLSSFNKGDSVNLILKAAYDNEFIYILAEWNDQYANASFKSWFFNGPPDPYKQDDTTGWTSQKNDDNLILNFPLPGTSAYHLDIWKWSLALSEPVGHGIDLHMLKDSSITYDKGTPPYSRNWRTDNNRAGPMYEWNGESQQVTKGDGNLAILDPAYYLFNTTTFTGDPKAGDAVYKNSCSGCHGTGPEAYAAPLIGESLNRYSRKALADYSASPFHDGKSYYEKLDSSQKENLAARIRSLSGIPGHVLHLPEGSSADILASSNVVTSNIIPWENNRYKVLLYRKLSTGNEDDIQFEPGEKYVFSIFLTDNDEINYIGTLTDTLVFTD